jgi:diguanylate cyclase (GGDEF)-like protein
MAVTDGLKQAVYEARDYLPKGQSLPEDVWRIRHRALCYLLRAHVVGIFFYGLLRGFGVVHSLAEAGLVAIFACLATTDGRRRRFTSAMAAVGLVMSSAVIVHLSGGVIEAHFHFFVMVGILTLYQDWRPFLIAIGFVVFHHAAFGVLAPAEVFNHPEAVSHPFEWALIHGAFVLAASVASVVAWRLNEEQALKDSLTRLPNRRLFHDRVAHALARGQRRPGTMAVLFIDLDKFKDVNDSLGHPSGDHLLTSVAERLRAILRPGDTAARLGGDEFAVLVEDIGGESDAVKVAQRLLDALASPFNLRGRELTVGASVGIAVSAPGDTVDDLLRNADVAMYTAKQSGRGRHECFVPDMHAAVVRRVEMENYLRRAADDGEFVLHYQPIFALATGRLAGFEALLRWQHPTRGLLAPSEFLAVAEESGAIVGIGAWVIDAACRQARQWRDHYPGHLLTMSVNLSPTQLKEPGIVEVVERVLLSSGLPAGDLTLELTEGVMVSATGVIVERLHALKNLGVQLAIDDFGTGYSSLGHLRQLPFDVLKIDKTFVDDVADGSGDSAFARAIIKLGQTLGLTMVAEGVEHADQAARLGELGCDFAQGYWFAKPLNVDGVEAVLSVAAGPNHWVGLDRLDQIGRAPS